MVSMTEKRAKLVIIISQLPPECRYAEYIATKLDCNYSRLCEEIRKLSTAGWLWQEKGVNFKRKKFLSINQVGLKEAAIEYLNKKNGGD